MILQARPLQDVGGVNSYRYGQNFEFTEGFSGILYFQLCDASKDTLGDGFRPAGRRYMPASGATLSVSIMNIDDAKVITRACTQPYPTDGSIWSVTIMDTDQIRGTASLKLVLTEGAVVTRGLVNGLFRVTAATNV